MSGSVQDRADPANRGLASGARRRRPIHVVAGVLTDSADRVLLAQRPEGKHLAGGWEIPGGKLEPGETRYDALVRELHEELGIAVLAARPLIRARHQYPTREIVLDVWVVTAHRGEPAGLDGQALRWCARADLPAAKLLPADRPIVTALRLPERITAASTEIYDIREMAAGCDGAGLELDPMDTRLCGAFCDGRQSALGALARGAQFLVVTKALEPSAVRALSESVNLPLYICGVSLDEAWNLGATGVNEIGLY